MADKKHTKDEETQAKEQVEAAREAQPETTDMAPLPDPVDLTDQRERLEADGLTPEEIDRSLEAHKIDAEAQRLRLESNFKAGEEQEQMVRESLLKQNDAERVSRGFDPMSTQAERKAQLIDAYMNGAENYEQLASRFDLDTETVALLIEEDQAKRSRA